MDEKKRKKNSQLEDTKSLPKGHNLKKETENNFNPMKRLARRAYLKHVLNRGKEEKSIPMEININFVRDSKKTKYEFPKRSLEDDFNSIRADEEKIIKWIFSNKKNLKAFALDPIDALYNSNIRITSVKSCLKNFN